MTTFDFWYNEIADMPTQAPDGSWFDLETGLAFDNKVKTDNSKDNKKNAKLRQAARNLGGKALKGTVKQKKWAEQIRKSFIENCIDTDFIKLLLTSDSLISAKFWIETRDNNELESDLRKLFETVEKANNREDINMKDYSNLIEKLCLS